MLPRTSSWATFRRPFETQFERGEFSRTHEGLSARARCGTGKFLLRKLQIPRSAKEQTPFRPCLMTTLTQPLLFLKLSRRSLAITPAQYPGANISNGFCSTTPVTHDPPVFSHLAAISATCKRISALRCLSRFPGRCGKEWGCLSCYMVRPLPSRRIAPSEVRASRNNTIAIPRRTRQSTT
jgi:hypothetical protein